MQHERRFEENSVLEIQLDVSIAIIITKEEAYLEDDQGVSDELTTYYKIVRYNGYGGDDWMLKSSLKGCFELLENEATGYYGTPAWWLLTRALYIDESLKSFISERIKFYYLTGELDVVASLINFDYRMYSDYRIDSDHRARGYGPESFVYWLSLAPINVSVIRNLLSTNGTTGNNQIHVYYKGFGETFLISFCTIKIDTLQSFQQLLNYLYQQISGQVNKQSYGNEWELANLTRSKILKKVGVQDSRTLGATGILSGDKLLCRKLNRT